MNCRRPTWSVWTALVAVGCARIVAWHCRTCPRFRRGNIAVNLQPIATGMAAPDYGISPPGDTSRLFVVEQNGLLRIIQNGSAAAGRGARHAKPRAAAAQPGQRQRRARLPWAGVPSRLQQRGERRVSARSTRTPASRLPPARRRPTRRRTTRRRTTRCVITEWKMSAGESERGRSRVRAARSSRSARTPATTTAARSPSARTATCTSPSATAAMPTTSGASHIEPGGNAQNLDHAAGQDAPHRPAQPRAHAWQRATRPAPTASTASRTTNPFDGAGQVPEIYALGLPQSVPLRVRPRERRPDPRRRRPEQHRGDQPHRRSAATTAGRSRKATFLFDRANGTIGAAPGNAVPAVRPG